MTIKVSSKFKTQSERMLAFKGSSKSRKSVSIQQRWLNDSKLSQAKLQKRFGKKLSDKEMDQIINKRIKELQNS